jgi:hypothetical protein
MIKKTMRMLMAVVLGAAIGGTATYIVVTTRRLDSPYLTHPDRLGDVVAALSVMGTYQNDGLLPDGPESGRPEEKRFSWEQAIGSKPQSVTKWSELFRQHPEFFRIDEMEGKMKAYLVWRRARERLWDTQSRKELTESEVVGMSQAEQDKRLSRKPLELGETTQLIAIAVNMQNQAIARRQELRWWIPVFGAVAGALIATLFKSNGKDHDQE